MPFADLGTDRLYYVQQGEQGLPVIFVHGSAGSHLVWWNQVAGLKDTARAIAFDLPGHGKSSGSGRDSVPAYADIVVRLLDALGVERAMVVGHSLGGAIAQTVALTHPDRVAALGLIGTGARLRVLPAILEGVLSPEDFDKTAELVTENTYAAPINPELRRRSLEQFKACPPSIIHGDFAACNVFDVMARLGEIHAPTLIVCGKDDRMTPVKYSEFLASKIAQSQLVVIDGAGHSVMLEQPEKVNQALVEFVSRLTR